MQQTALSYDPKKTNNDLVEALQLIRTDYPVSPNDEEATMVNYCFDPSAEGPELAPGADGGHQLTYATIPQALRATGALLAGLDSTAEETTFQKLGIMLDCSRNAVMTVSHVKLWLRRLALLGYNMVMLYTEDTYELPGEPYFGYQRGRYTADEIRELDDYAACLGIELVSCFQTLGHLEQILKWPAYSHLKDSESVLMVDADETYALIEKMLVFWKENLRTNRVHIGMDETWGLGRGGFMDRFGVQDSFEIFNRHLAKVVDMCRTHGLEPMIWSDMYFRLGSRKHEYYDPEVSIPEDVVANIPKDVNLVYWDYYHDDESEYLRMIQYHRDIGYNPIMGSGIWTWNKTWHDHTRTEAQALPCIEACRETGLEEIFFTMWGDDGAFCDFDSSWTGLTLCADRAFGCDNDATTAQRFNVLFNSDYETIVSLSKLNDNLPSHTIIWDDPILSSYLSHVKANSPEQIARTLDELRSLQSEVSQQTGCVNAGDLSHAQLLAKVCVDKIQLFLDFQQAYSDSDQARLRDLLPRINHMGDSMQQLSQSFRTGWMRRNKPFGFESIQLRLAGQIARYGELHQRLTELLSQEISCIPEFDGNLPGAPGGNVPSWRYRDVAYTTCIR